MERDDFSLFTKSAGLGQRVNRRLLWLALFAVSMAHVEASLVVYLREIYYPDDVRALFPLRLLSDAHLRLELAREAATILMILAVALIAERGFLRVFAAFVYVFGLWDIFYYVWLKLAIGWPLSWLQWDVLFLIPWPWFGPWVTPVAIAVLFVLWGGWVVASPRSYRVTALPAALFALGVVIALAAFLQPGFVLLPEGTEGFRLYVPDAFGWGLYGAGVVLMAVGMLLMLRGTTDR